MLKPDRHFIHCKKRTALFRIIYKESSVNSLPMFWNILSVPSSRAKNPKRIMELPLLTA